MRLLALAVLGVMGTCGGLSEPPLQAPPPPTAEPTPPPAPPTGTDAGRKKDSGAKPDASSNDDLDLG